MIASYEEGAFVLRPANIPFVAVTRWLDAGHMCMISRPKATAAILNAIAGA